MRCQTALTRRDRTHTHTLVGGAGELGAFDHDWAEREALRGRAGAPGEVKLGLVHGLVVWMSGHDLEREEDAT